MTHAGIKFMKEHQDGKYGDKITGNVKALMYRQAPQCHTKKQVRDLHDTCNRALYAYERLHPLKSGDENWCWISQKGDIYYCGFGEHSLVSRNVFFTIEAEFEKTHAKITMCTKDEDEALYYVKRPSAIMKRVVAAVFDVQAAHKRKTG